MDPTAVLVQRQLASGALNGGTATEVGASAVVGALLPIIVGMLKKKA